MWTIYADNVRIYDDTTTLNEHALISPNLRKTINTAGELSFILPVGNIGYNSLQQFKTRIRVCRNGEEIWEGRVYQESKDFYKNRSIVCEGTLAFLNDTIQMPKDYPKTTARELLETLIAVHNRNVDASRRFQVGYVSVEEPPIADDEDQYVYTNWNTTLDAIMSLLVERLKGYIFVRKVDGVRYIDIVKELPDTSAQQIKFGENLLDYTQNWDLEKFCTVIYPKGMRYEESSIEPLEEYCSIEEVNNGKPYLVNQSAVNTYGWIEKVVEWPDIGFPDKLLAQARKYIQDQQFSDIELNVTALDLSYLDVSVDSIDIGDRIRVISTPHGMDRLFPVVEISIPLDQPENTTFTLGDRISETFTHSSSNTIQAVYQELDNVYPNVRTIVDIAKENVTALMNRKTTGFFTIVEDENGSNEVYFSSEKDYTKADRVWKWSMSGLGYSNTGYLGPYETAITMDGTIVGKFIAANSIAANQLTVEYRNTIDGKFQDLYAGQGRLESSISDLNSDVSSSITQLSNSITQEVSNQTSGLRSRIQVLEGQISSSVSSGSIGTEIIQNRDSIMAAINADAASTYFKFDTYGMSLYSSSGSNRSNYNKIIGYNTDGLNFYYNGSSKASFIGCYYGYGGFNRYGLELNLYDTNGVFQVVNSYQSTIFSVESASREEDSVVRVWGELFVNQGIQCYNGIYCLTGDLQGQHTASHGEEGFSSTAQWYWRNENGDAYYFYIRNGLICTDCYNY